jgi:hypothetical protein
MAPGSARFDEPYLEALSIKNDRIESNNGLRLGKTSACGIKPISATFDRRAIASWKGVQLK